MNENRHVKVLPQHNTVEDEIPAEKIGYDQISPEKSKEKDRFQRKNRWLTRYAN